MHSQVEQDRHIRLITSDTFQIFAVERTYDRGLSEQLRPAESSGCAVVVGVKECQWLLLQEEEHGVNQLNVFGDVVELIRLVACPL